MRNVRRLLCLDEMNRYVKLLDGPHTSCTSSLSHDNCPLIPRIAICRSLLRRVADQSSVLAKAILLKEPG